MLCLGYWIKRGVGEEMDTLFYGIMFFFCEKFLILLFIFPSFSKFIFQLWLTYNILLISGILHGNTFNLLGSLIFFLRIRWKLFIFQRTKCTYAHNFTNFGVHGFQILEASSRPFFLSFTWWHIGVNGGSWLHKLPETSWKLRDWVYGLSMCFSIPVGSSALTKVWKELTSMPKTI